MTLISFNSALFFNFVIRPNGSTLSKLRSKMIKLGLDLALISTSCSSFTNSTVMPARLAASLILTEKKRSLKTARTFLLPCFCIQFSYINSFSEELQAGLGFWTRLKPEGRLHLTRFKEAAQDHSGFVSDLIRRDHRVRYRKLGRA